MGWFMKRTWKKYYTGDHGYDVIEEDSFENGKAVELEQTICLIL